LGSSFLDQTGGAMPDMTSWIGGAAAILTSLSYVPQVRKALPRGATHDLSLRMLGVLTAGLALWALYGALQSDWVIVAANGVGGTLAAIVLGCKLRDMRAGRPRPAPRNRIATPKLG
jgi:MtN3 and saliva related transmembrane protein